MTSILTNTAAMAALQTLRGIDKGMEETQARVSSGQRVRTASDNAAYWSIATTMRSDNMALSAVKDAIGLGAAKVDTAYAAMESAVSVVKEIKAKITAAAEDGVDKTKIQEEIKQLQDQLRSISESASFSGENWLQANLDVTGSKVVKSVVGSFVRDADGNVSVKKIEYTLDTTTVLFDKGDTTGGYERQGILDATAKNGTNAVQLTPVQIVKDVISTKTADDLIAQGATYKNGTAGVDTNNDGTGDMESFNVGSDVYIRYYDATGNIQTDATTGKELWARIHTLSATSDASEISRSLTANKSGGGAFANAIGTYYYAEDQINVSSEVTALTRSSITSAARTATGTPSPQNLTVTTAISGRIATIATNDGVSTGTEVYIQVDAAKDVWVKVATGNATDDLLGIDINGVNYDIVENNKALPVALAGADLGFSVSNLDITKLSTIATAMGGTEANALAFMLDYVERRLEAIISASSSLGSISKRIELQEDFVSKLTSSIDKGIGRLVDADMNEESTRLKALQTQQQLAVQSLSIANANSENILTLFRQ